MKIDGVLCAHFKEQRVTTTEEALWVAEIDKCRRSFWISFAEDIRLRKQRMIVDHAQAKTPQYQPPRRSKK